MTEKVATVICITARKEPGLKEFISSVLKQEYPLGLIELIIVDKIKKERPEITAILKDAVAKLGLRKALHLEDPPTDFIGPCPSSARNYAISQSEGDWIVTVDDLTELLPDTVAKHMIEFGKGFDVLACSYNVSSPSESNIIDDREDPRLETFNGFYYSPQVRDNWVAVNLFGMHVGYSRESILKINGYDSLFDGVYGQEDMDIGLRFQNAGCVFKWCPEIRVLCARDDRHAPTHATMFKDKKDVPIAYWRGSYRWRNDLLLDMLPRVPTRIRANPGFDLSKGEYKNG